MSETIYTKELGKAIKRRRKQLGMSLRGVMLETGVSASTVSRLENGIGTPDACHVVALSKWLGAPVERFLPTIDGAVSYRPDEPLPEIVRELLRGDLQVSDAGRRTLGDVFALMYKQFAS